MLRRGPPPPRELTWRSVIVTGEVALAFVLLVSLRLVGRSLLDVLKVNSGFDAHGVLILQVSVPAASYSNGERVGSFYSALQSALEEPLEPHTISIVNEIPLTREPALSCLRRDARRTPIL